jgi:hypothetical protein
MLISINSYGPKGFAVFQATLNKLFNPQTAAINPDIFAPMTLDRFNEFVLIPHIACRLIAEDRKCNIEEAFRVMVASGDAGDLLQPIVDSGKDERFDNLLMNIMRKDTVKVCLFLRVVTLLTYTTRRLFKFASRKRCSTCVHLTNHAFELTTFHSGLVQMAATHRLIGAKALVWLIRHHSVNQ